MAFCSLDEAFAGPSSIAAAPQLPAAAKQSKKKKHREMFTPGPFMSAPDPDRQAAPPPPANDILSGPPTDKVPTEGTSLDNLFHMPGETGDVEEWEKAFTLEGSKLPPPAAPTYPAAQHRADGSLVVSGQPTLWRQISQPAAAAASAVAEIPSEINQRLEALTRQLESLHMPTPLQGTAELFLFVAIGLMILLAIDTMLRFAVSLSERRIMAGGAYGAPTVASWR
jgi:hypothetical protein